MAQRAVAKYLEIVSRFRRAGIPAFGYIYYKSVVLQNHFDIVDSKHITATIPLTDTMGTVLRSCQTYDCDPRKQDGDLQKTPMLKQGDAQFFHGGLMMHEAPMRRKGDVWIIMRMANEEGLTVKEMIDRLSYVRDWDKAQKPATVYDEL